MIAWLRAAAKFASFLAITARALADFHWNVRARGGALPLQADWSQRWGRAYRRLLNIHLTFTGTPPADGILACNHLSYLDIVILASVRPQVFLSKAEVQSWPMIGALTRAAGTLFIRRERRSDVALLQKSFADVIDQGLPITIFPEGTSTDGMQVRPFHSSLLEPAAAANWPVTPAWLGYRLDHGNVGEEICYWGDMTFAPHFLKLLAHEKIYAEIIYGAPIRPGLNRKEMAAELHQEVRRLSRLRGRGSDLVEQEDTLNANGPTPNLYPALK